MKLLAGILLLYAVATDLKHRRIPNSIVLCLIAFGFVNSVGLLGFKGMLYWAAGIFTGIGLLLIPYILGGIGAGDVKLLGGIGSILWPVAVIECFLAIAVAGAVIALVKLMMSKQLGVILRKLRIDCLNLVHHRSLAVVEVAEGENAPGQGIPYAVPIFIGYLVYLWLSM